MPKETLERDRIYWVRQRKNFGQKVLRRKREALGLSQFQMAALIGVDQPSISRMENGAFREDVATAIATKDHYQLNQRQTNEFLYLCTGLTFDDLVVLTVVHTPEQQNPDWRTAREILQSWLVTTQYDVSELAQEIGIHTHILVQFLNEKITLDHGSAMKLSEHMHPITRRAFVGALGRVGAGWVFSLNLTSGTSQDLEMHSKADLLLEALSEQAQLASQLKILGHPQAAIEATAHLANKLEVLINEPMLAKDRPAVLKMLGELLYHQGWAYSETSGNYENWDYTTGFSKKLRELSQKYSESSFAALADSFEGNGLYIAKKYDKAIPNLEKALSREQNADHRLVILSTLAKIWGSWQISPKFHDVEGQIMDLGQSGKFENLVHLSEAYSNLARAQAFMKSEEAYNSLTKAEKVLEEMSRGQGWQAPIAKVLFVSDKLQVIKELDPKGHPKYVNECGQEAARLAQHCYYPRLENRIKQLVEILT